MSTSVVAEVVFSEFGGGPQNRSRLDLEGTLSRYARFWWTLTAVTTVALASLTAVLFLRPRAPRWLPPPLVGLGMLSATNALLMVALKAGEDEL